MATQDKLTETNAEEQLPYTFYKTEATKILTAYLTKAGFTGHQAIVAESRQCVKTYLLCNEKSLPYYENQSLETVAAYIDMGKIANAFK